METSELLPVQLVHTIKKTGFCHELAARQCAVVSCDNMFLLSQDKTKSVPMEAELLWLLVGIVSLTGSGTRVEFLGSAVATSSARSGRDLISFTTIFDRVRCPLRGK